MSEQRKARLDSFVSLVTDKVNGRKDASKPYIGLEHIPSNGSTLLGSGTALDSVSTNNVFRAGDVLFGKLRPGLRKSIALDFGGYCSTDILVLRPHIPADASYASFVLRSEALLEASRRTEEGTKMPSSSWQSLRGVRVFCPEHADRVTIARILSTLDNAINQTEALMAKYQQIKKGLMNDLFAHGITADGNLRPSPSDAPYLISEFFSWLDSQGLGHGYHW